MANREVLLEMKDISKSFPGVKALDKVSLTLERGSVLALMGENGAGKSTLMKCLFGMQSTDSGEVLLEGKAVKFKNPKDALEQGVAMVHQELNQAADRSVADNIWLGRYPTKLGFVVSEGEMKRKTKEIFHRLKIDCDPLEIMKQMSVAKRQMAEIAKAVSYNAKVIVLDEPTSSLTDREVEKLFEIIDTLKKQGCGIIYISHKMDEIFKIADKITVMRDGKTVDTKPADQITMDEIISLMVGRQLSALFPEKKNKPGEVIFKAESISGRYNHLRDVSFTLRKGEILGIAGLAGAGRTEVIESVFGLAARQSGRLYLDGKEIQNKTPREAIKNGFALLTEERRANGIFGNLDIRENTTISSLDKHLKLFLLSDRSRAKDTKEMIDTLQVKTASQDTQIKNLSGGNQQKVIFGRWLLTEPRILMLDEPTRGIDIGAKSEIYKLILSLAEEGKSVIMLSGELPELLGLCDRILVMSGGRVAGEVDAAKTNQEELMTLAAKYV